MTAESGKLSAQEVWAESAAALDRQGRCRSVLDGCGKQSKQRFWGDIVGKG